MVVLKCVSNILVCVQCSAGFAIFTHKDTRYEFYFEIKTFNAFSGSGIYSSKYYPVDKNNLRTLVNNKSTVYVLSTK